MFSGFDIYAHAWNSVVYSFSLWGSSHPSTVVLLPKIPTCAFITVTGCNFSDISQKEEKNTHVLVETLITFPVLCLKTISNKINDLDSCAYDYVSSVN